MEAKEEEFCDGEVGSCVNCYKDVTCEYVQRKIREILKVLCSFCHTGGHYF